MIGRTNIKKQGMSNENALIHVIVDINSTITFSKDNIIIKVLNPINGHINTINNNKADYYYSINSNNFGVWTITATLDEETRSETLTVDTIKQYDVNIVYDFYLIKNGYLDTSLKSKFVGQSGLTATEAVSGAVQIYHAKPSGQTKYGGYFNTALDLSLYSTCYVDMQIVSCATNDGKWAQWVGYGGTNTENSFYFQVNFASGSSTAIARQTKSLNISSAKTPNYLKFHFGADSSHTFDGRIFNLWLRR